MVKKEETNAPVAEESAVAKKPARKAPAKAAAKSPVLEPVKAPVKRAPKTEPVVAKSDGTDVAEPAKKVAAKKAPAKRGAAKKPAEAELADVAAPVASAPLAPISATSRLICRLRSSTPSVDVQLTTRVMMAKATDALALVAAPEKRARLILSPLMRL
jgi:hypothetical protein